MTPPPEHSILEDAWGQVVGGMDWLKSVLFGEFADHRPLSAVVADMLVSFIPGVVIVTSARDAVAVILRLANHPEKREDLMEWVLLSACLIVIALPLAMAAGGAAAAGVGAIVGGIAGSELGAALRSVMLLLIKEASKLVELIRFLQKFIKGDILKFLRAVKFAKYEKPLLQALSKISGKLVDIVKSLRSHLESLSYFDRVKASIAKLAAWEKKFYAVQQDAIRQVPKALAELDARLTKLLSETAPKEAHTVPAGVQADKAAAAAPAKQRVKDTPGKVLPRVEDKPAAPTPKPAAKPAAKPKPKATPKPPADPPPPLKDAPDPVKPPDEGANTKKQAVADAAVAVDREHVSALSRAGKIEEARAYLREKVLDNPNIAPADKPKALIDRLDVSSPKDKSVFWSGDIEAAKAKAAEIGGVTLETTDGGRVADKWEDLKTDFPGWRDDPPPNGYDFWTNLSKKYATEASGDITVVQSAKKAAMGGGDVWKNAEFPVLSQLQEDGVVGDIKYIVVPDK